MDHMHPLQPTSPRGVLYQVFGDIPLCGSKPCLLKCNIISSMLAKTRIPDSTALLGAEAVRNQMFSRQWRREQQSESPPELIGIRSD
jgi:hypothetical protein